jgi:hypothetical protein
VKAEERDRWIHAAKVLATDPRAEVLCPRNEDALLVVTDDAEEPERAFERHMRCPKCGAYNSIRMLKQD